MEEFKGEESLNKVSAMLFPGNVTIDIISGAYFGHFPFIFGLLGREREKENIRMRHLACLFDHCLARKFESGFAVGMPRQTPSKLSIWSKKKKNMFIVPS